MEIIKTNFCNFVILDVDLKKLKYKSNEKQVLYYNTKTPRKNNLTFKNFLYLQKCIEKGTNEIMKSYDQNYKFDIFVSSIWEHEYLNKDFQEDHVHYTEHFSFIIYTKGTPGTIFKNPWGYYLQSMYPKFNDYLATYEVRPKVSKGQMIFFPSYIPHYVVQTSKTKTVVGDIQIKR
jgi:hypothetical protein